MTSVKIIDFNYVHYVNAEVEVLLPEESGIVQIEVRHHLPRLEAYFTQLSEV